MNTAAADVDATADAQAQVAGENKPEVEATEPADPQPADDTDASTSEGATKAPEESVEDVSETDGDPDTDEETSRAFKSLQDKVRKVNRENQNLRARAKEAEEQLAARDTSRVEALEAKLERYEVAAQVGLPLEWAVRLQGDSRDALLKDATELAKVVTKRPRTSGGFPADGHGITPENGAEAKSLTEIGEAMYRN